MPEDLYDDSPGGAPSPEPEAGQQESGPSKTAVLPKACFPDAKPGDNITCKVTRVNEQDIEVEPQGCAKDDKSEEEPPEEQPPQEDAPPGDMRSMLED
jgi:hypothetical protein